MNQTTYFAHLWYGSSQAHTLLARNILGHFSVIDTQHLVHSAHVPHGQSYEKHGCNL